MIKTNLWAKDELIIALNLYWKIPYNKISGTSNKQILQYSKLLNRSPASIAFKLMNFTSLDSERQKSGNKGKQSASKLDRLVWSEYEDKWEKLSNDSSELISRITKQPIDVYFSIDEDSESYEGYEKERVVKTRINQNDFRSRVLASYNEKCCITGIDITSLLVASHIIPWSVCANERLNPKNGLCLNPIHDKAFDQGFITINQDYRVKVSSIIIKKKANSSIKSFFMKYEGFEISLPDRFLPDKDFLVWHNTNVFKH